MRASRAFEDRTSKAARDSVVATWRDAAASDGKRARKGFSKKLKRKLKEQAGWRCRVCGSTSRLTIDHIVPLTKDGTNNQDNLQVLCITCNEKKGGSYA